MMRSMQSRAATAAAVLALAAVPAVIATIGTPADSKADVCTTAGGPRVSVSGCANLADVIAPYAPPPGYYAPMPDDPYYPPPPPPPPLPNVNVCANVGRRISVSGCI